MEPAEVPIAAGGVGDVEAGLLQRHEDAGTDADRHGTAAADDRGEATSVGVPVS